MSLDADLCRADLQGLQRGDSLSDLALTPDDADQVVHRLLKLLVQRVGVLTLVLEGCHGCSLTSHKVRRQNLGPVVSQTQDVRRRTRSGAPSEDEQVGQRVAAEAVGTVHPSG